MCRGLRSGASSPALAGPGFAPYGLRGCAYYMLHNHSSCPRDIAIQIEDLGLAAPCVLHTMPDSAVVFLLVELDLSQPISTTTIVDSGHDSAARQISFGKICSPPCLAHTLALMGL